MRERVSEIEFGRASIGALLIALLLGLAAAGCSPAEGPDPAADGNGARAEEGVATDTSDSGADEQVDARPRPSVIYYNLTAVEWYRRGEPILLEGRHYLPGKVEATGERHFEKGGAYSGVDYYLRRGEAELGREIAVLEHDTIYVPVYDGYWLPFAFDGAGSVPESAAAVD